jgi:hypothetical protein
MPKKPSTIIDLDESTLVEVLQERQQKLLALMPNYARRVTSWAIWGFVIYLMFPLMQKLVALITVLVTSPRSSISDIIVALGNELQKIFVVSNFTLGSLISIVLSLFSNVIMWAFVIWSLSFVPYLAYHSYKLSQEARSKLATRPLKWVQLFASTFLPMAAFAIAWNSTATHTSDIVVQIRSMEEAVILAIGTIIVAGFLFAINFIVPANAIAIRLSLFSALIYASLFLAYGQGYSVASFAMLFGILFYLIFASEQIEEMGRRIVIYDLDPSIAKKVDVINARIQELQITRDETVLSERENRMLQEQAKAKGKLAESQMEQRLGEQLSEIQTKKIELVHKMNQAQIELLEQKINMLGIAFDIISKEYSTKLTQDFPKQLEELREAARTLPPQELYAKMDAFMRGMNLLLEGLPETFSELKAQLLKAASDLEKQTRLLLTGPSDKSDDEE